MRRSLTSTDSIRARAGVGSIETRPQVNTSRHTPINCLAQSEEPMRIFAASGVE